MKIEKILNKCQKTKKKKTEHSIIIKTVNFSNLNHENCMQIIKRTFG